jgi:hypothetical protein
MSILPAAVEDSDGLRIVSRESKLTGLSASKTQKRVTGHLPSKKQERVHSSNPNQKKSWMKPPVSLREGSATLSPPVGIIRQLDGRTPRQSSPPLWQPAVLFFGSMQERRGEAAPLRRTTWI